MGLPGTVFLDRYRIVRPLARGAVSTVYLAFDDRGNPYAVKVFPRGFAARADREWRVGSTLNHPNVNKVIQRFAIDEYPAVLMELSPGSRLSDLERMPQPAFVAVFAQLLAALAHMHRLGFVHRDVKPENLIVDGSGRSRLLDFDLSGPQDEPIGRLRLGTIAYISPEQVRGENVVPASDLYAAGVIFYWGLTGELPFVGDPKTVMNDHLHSPLPKLDSVTASGYAGFLKRLAAKDPAERFRDAGEALDALQAIDMPTQ